jgi:hypothetical protein
LSSINPFNYNLDINEIIDATTKASEAALHLAPEVRVPEVLDVIVRALREVRRNCRPPAQDQYPSAGPNQSPSCSHQ